jgi:hypothetical protein
MIVTSNRAATAAAFAVAALMLAAAAPLAAQDDTKKKGGESSYVAALRDCQGETGPAERLACYDTAVAAIVAASSEGEVRVVDREDVRQTRRKLFGFALPDLGIFGGDSDKEDPAQAEEFAALQTTIKGIRSTREGFILITAEGAEWEVDSVPARLMRPKIGEPLEIRKGALSSFFVRIDGQKGVKARRVR